MSVLLNTKLRSKLLTYSFTHPDENYYVRELSGLIDEDPGNLSRELKKLEAEGLYTSTKKGNVKFYSLNRRYPLFKELKKIIFKTEGVEGSLKEAVSRFKGISFAFIYGSYAKDKEKKTSDIDMVAVGRRLRWDVVQTIQNHSVWHFGVVFKVAICERNPGSHPHMSEIMRQVSSMRKLALI